MTPLTTLKHGCATAILVLAALASPVAHAGRSCTAPQPPRTTTVERALTLAERTHQALEASGARVVVLARAGQDLSKYGLRYSHVGIAYQQDDGQGGHVWRVLHKLNECGTAVSAIYRQGLGEFFLDDLWRFEAAWVVLSPEAQTRLLAVLQDPYRATDVHHKPYSMVSYAWGQTYQQSNQWAIETLALAMQADTARTPLTRGQAQAWLQGRQYVPSMLRIGAMTRLGARMTAANVAFDDHPPAQRFSDNIETVTADSVLQWLPRAGLGQPMVTLRP